MERERLKHLLQAPDQVERADLVDLRSLTDRFPWFSGAQILRAYGEQTTGDVSSDETLRVAAAHVPSRAVIFDLLNTACAVAPLTVAAPPTTTFTVVPNPTTAPLGPAAPEPWRPAEPESTATSTLSTEVHDPEPEAPEAGTGTEPIAATVEVEEVPTFPADPLERQILEAALASAYDLTLLAPIAPSVETPAAPSEELKLVPQQVVPLPVVPEPTVAAPTAVATAVAAQSPAPRSPKRHARQSFSAWLEPESQAAAAPSFPPEDVRAEEEHEQLPIAPAPPAAPADTLALVDRFIQQEVAVIAPKTAFFTPQQAAKRSLDDSAGLVTETLARIYAQQGNVAKAIAAYKKLALKYPDKSAYFAALSQALEAQQNK